jgi:hypothetical protein
VSTAVPYVQRALQQIARLLIAPIFLFARLMIMTAAAAAVMVIGMGMVHVAESDVIMIMIMIVILIVIMIAIAIMVMIIMISIIIIIVIIVIVIVIVMAEAPPTLMGVRRGMRVCHLSSVLQSKSLIPLINAGIITSKMSSVLLRLRLRLLIVIVIVTVVGQIIIGHSGIKMRSTAHCIR